jgi:hypothetical protein
MMNNKLLKILLFAMVWPVMMMAQTEPGFKGSSKSEVALGEQFRIVYELNADGSRFKGPDFDGLRVITGPMTSSSSSIQIINGQMTRSYNQTYTYVVVATREGEINLKPATVVVDGKKISSNTINIKVQPASSATTAPSQQQRGAQQHTDETGISEKDLFLRAIVDKTSPLLGEQVIMTYRLYTRVPISSISVNKLSSFPGFWVKNLLDEGAPLQQSTQIVDGEEYVVADIRKMALFPQRSGKITIEPMELEGTAQVRVQDDRRRSRDPFESFFNDPFFNRNVRNVERVLVSNPVEIEVKALPFAGRPKDFGGAVGQFTLQASIDRNALKTNEALNLTYTISGKGNIELIEMPKPVFPPDFEVYEPKVTGQANASASGVSGTRKIEFLAIPRSPGEFTIPAVEFSYFDPVIKEYVLLTSEAFSVDVERGADSGEDIATSVRAREGIRYLGSDIQHIKPETHTLKPVNSFFFFSNLYIGLLGLGVVFFAAILIYYRKATKLRKNQSLLRNRQATKVARKRLKTAHKHMHIKEQNEFYMEMSQALWGYLANKFNITRADLSFETVKEALGKTQVPEALRDEFIQVLNNCEYARFAPGDASEKMEELYKQGIQIISKTERTIK